MADDTTTPTTPATRDTAKHGRRLTNTQVTTILALHAAGKSNPEIATIIGCDKSTVWSTIQNFESTADLASKFLNGQNLMAAKAWARAVKRAATKGRHEPARDLLVANRVIDVSNQNSSGPNVAVFVGLGPQLGPQPVVVEGQALSGDPAKPQQVGPAHELPLLVVDAKLT